MNHAIQQQLIKHGLKITPQRMAILGALLNLNNHPTAENISEFIRENHPHIAAGTVYKTLETFVEKGLIKKVKTENDVMRYDAITEKHHHIYCQASDRIEDYFDEELDNLLENYFKKKKIQGFKITDLKLQIHGEFLNENS